MPTSAEISIVNSMKGRLQVHQNFFQNGFFVVVGTQFNSKPITKTISVHTDLLKFGKLAKRVCICNKKNILKKLCVYLKNNTF